MIFFDLCSAEQFFKRKRKTVSSDKKINRVEGVSLQWCVIHHVTEICNRHYETICAADESFKTSPAITLSYWTD